MSTSHKNKIRTRSLQSLENRHMMTGNVLGLMSGTTLELTGDANDNEIEVVQIAPNTIEVIGHSGTTVNGLPSDLFTFSLLENIQADLHDGNDKAAFESIVLPDSLNVTTGIGDDDVKLHRVQTYQSSINTGDDQDRVRIHDVNVADRLAIETESGKDVVTLHRLQTNELDVFTGYENDRVGMHRVHAGGIIQVITEDGHDGVYMKNVDAQGIFMDNGLGNDRDRMERVRAGRIDVLTGSHMDALHMNEVHANDINIDSLSGDDHVHLSNVEAVNRLYLDSGLQTDKVFLEDVKASTLDILTGSADDSLVMQNVSGTDIVVDTLDGNDFISASNINVGNSFTMQTGDDDDVVELNNVISPFASGTIDIQLGRGDDSLRVNRLWGNDVHINTCDGNDTIDASWVIAADELFIEMGDGEDSLALQNSWGGIRVIDGGPGFDTLFDLSNFFDEVADSINFESVI